MSKYRAKRCEIDGYHFDSLAEASRYSMLKLIQQAGEVTDLQVHPRYMLQDKFSYQYHKERAIYYEADFQYWLDGRLIVEDVKGFKTAVYLIKRKLFLNVLSKGLMIDGRKVYPVFEEIEV